MNHLLRERTITAGLIVLTLVCTLATFLVGCANVKHALFEPRVEADGTVNTNGAVQPRAVVVDSVATTGGLFGPQGQGVAALIVAGLGLVASVLNRSALKKHLAADGRPSAPAPPRGPPTS